MSGRVTSAVRSAVTRGVVRLAAVGARTLLQITGLAGETRVGVELLLPPGYSARPAAGADVVLFQVLGSRDHVVALGGDSAGGDAIADLAPGEFGFRHAATGMQAVFRNAGFVEMTAPLVKMSGDLHVRGEVIRGFGTGNQVTLGGHTHPVAAQPGSGVISAAPNAGT